jgi:hypothetical protein
MDIRRDIIADFKQWKDSSHVGNALFPRWEYFLALGHCGHEFIVLNNRTLLHDKGWLMKKIKDFAKNPSSLPSKNVKCYK